MNDILQLNLFGARKDDPQTSHDAAESIKPGAHRLMLLQAFEKYPQGLTAYEAGQIAKLLGVCYWKRVSELGTLNLVEDTGLTRPGPSGRQQRVMRITQEGMNACQLLE